MGRYQVIRKTTLLFLLIIFFLFGSVWTVLAVEKKVKSQPRPAPQQTVASATSINDSNLQANFKKAEEYLKKGEYQAALNIFLRIYDYTKSVMTTIGLLQKQYEKITNDQNVPLKDREDLLVKMRRMDQLVARYKKIKEISSLNIGYIYTKRGDTDRARRYLMEVLESTPFDMKKDSPWMKAKTLLLETYNLEGEF